MANPIRYYITCDDDQPVVRTIPVSVRPAEADQVDRSLLAPTALPRPEQRRPARVARLVRSAVRRAPAIR